MKGNCPFHGGKDLTDASFHIFFDKGYAKCFGCDAYVWNPIQLWAKLLGRTHSDALLDLRQTFGLKFLTASIQAPLNAWSRNQWVKKRIMQICHEELIEAIKLPDSPDYTHAREAVDYLLNTRQMPKEAIDQLDMIGVMPPLGRVLNAFTSDFQLETQRRIDDAAANDVKPEKAPDFTEEANAYLMNAQSWRGALVFRLDIAPDAIGRLKLSRPNTMASEARLVDDAFEEDSGFLGLGWKKYEPLLATGELAKYIEGVYLVESDFDALSILARQALTTPGYVVCAAGGKTQDIGDLDDFKQFGFSKLYLLPDRGTDLVEHWLPKIKQMHAYIFTGYDNFPLHCGTPDAVVCTIGLNALSTLLLDTTNRKLFQTPPDWVFDLAYPEIEKIDASDVRTRIETAGTKGRLLRNNIDCDTYVAACAKTFGFNAAQLKREIVAREEDEPGFILRLVDVLTQEFFPFGQESEGQSGRALYLWHKARREVIKVMLADDASIEREIGNKSGPSYQFFQEKVGIPAFLEVPDVVKSQGKYLQKQDKDYRWYLRQALTIISQNTPDAAVAEHKGQGLHVDPSLVDGNPPTLYLVNGRDVYIGTFGQQDSLTWVHLDGPSKDGVIFDVGIELPEKAWLTRVKTVDDLNKAPVLNPKDLYERLYKLIDIGWSFKHHAITVQFLAAHLLATTINNAFRRQVVVHFCADTSAGKSKFNLGLIGREESAQLHVIEAAFGMQQFTPAGIRQTMHNKVRPLCLDEFENDGAGNGANTDKKAKAVAETLEMIRSLTGENNKYRQGTRNGRAIEFNLRFFVFLSAIAPMHKVQDANRVVRIDMDRRQGKDSPEDAVNRDLGRQYVPALKDDLALGMFPYIAKIQRNYETLTEEWAVPGAKPSRVDQRYFQALFPAMSVMKLLGLDYRQWALDFVDAKQPSLIMQDNDNTDSAQLFNWMMQSPEILIRVEGGEFQRCSAIQVLATPAFREKLAPSGCGLYYDEPSQLLVVNWTAAVQSVLRHNSKYNKESNLGNLREMSMRSKHAVKAEDLLASGAMERLKMYGITFLPLSQITAYNVRHIIEGTDSMPSAQPVKELPVLQPRTSDDGDFGTC